MALMKKPEAYCPAIKPTIVDAKTNDLNMQVVKENWQLGPEKATDEPGANKEYWSKIAVAWQTSEDEARRQLCANCEYFNNTPEAMADMDSVPINKFDKDGGGRGYCHKFEFICHNLRVCKAWEKAPVMMENDDEND